MKRRTGEVWVRKTRCPGLEHPRLINKDELPAPGLDHLGTSGRTPQKGTSRANQQRTQEPLEWSIWGRQARRPRLDHPGWIKKKEAQTRQPRTESFREGGPETGGGRDGKKKANPGIKSKEEWTEAQD